MLGLNILQCVSNSIWRRDPPSCVDQAAQSSKWSRGIRSEETEWTQVKKMRSLRGWKPSMRRRRMQSRSCKRSHRDSRESVCKTKVAKQRLPEKESSQVEREARWRECKLLSSSRTLWKSSDKDFNRTSQCQSFLETSKRYRALRRCQVFSFICSTDLISRMIIIQLILEHMQNGSDECRKIIRCLTCNAKNSFSCLNTALSTLQWRRQYLKSFPTLQMSQLASASRTEAERQADDLLLLSGETPKKMLPPHSSAHCEVIPDTPELSQAVTVSEVCSTNAWRSQTSRP